VRFEKSNVISLSRLYWKVIYHNAFYLLAGRPMIRLFAITQHHRFRSIGKTKIIGDDIFIGYCVEFSRRLQEEDPLMYKNLFVKNKFIFIQYSDYKFQNFMFGEYAVPARYQKLKASGIGALMIYGFYCTESFGRTIGSHVRCIRQPGFSKIPIQKAYTWLTEHQFPDTILEWFSPKNKMAKNEAPNAGGVRPTN
jgi:hypothetical protein